ncbi:hypothetical protein N0V93_007060 [Gnomoniopsis smithogilvyi]|uniref:Anaphase-promoting complex subunit 13 n=1 Tax=Gnomoniopsis smithogilvyi TaxID=1191159 RepID=A0A9W8YR09_9PEZI|nr:hypothetical protein N0V93_007060 [Gnomoniopsis smithogilvyi]
MDPDAARRLQREQTTTAAARIRGTTNNNNNAARAQPQRRATTHTKKNPPITFPFISEPLSVTDSKIGRIHTVTMNKDAQHTSIHLHRARDADLLEQFCRDRLPSDDIYVPAAHQPVNPEDEDDVVPDQHAAFGIQRATQAKREPAWRDFGLGELMGRGPGVGVWKGVAGAGAAGGASKKTALPR